MSQNHPPGQSERLQVLESELAQARKEIALETALENVRARAMAMQKSEDLKEVVYVLYRQLASLNFQWGAASITIMDAATGDMDWWLEGFGDGYDFPESYHVPYFNHKGHEQQLDYWKNGYSYAVVEIAGRDKKSFDNYYFNQTDFRRVPENTKGIMKGQEAVLFSMAFMKYGALSWSPSPISEEQSIVLQRFSKVFEQSYTRFLDLQKAEAQAREAQIEAALERVRSRSMAMHDSSDLGMVVFDMFTELVKLDAKLDRCLILIVNPQTLGITWYLTGKEGLLSNNGFLVENNPHPSHQAYLEGWRTKRKKWHYLLEGEEKRNSHNYLFSQTQLARLPDFIKADMAAVESIHLTISSDDFGCLIASSISPLSEAHATIVDRFTSVFNQTYTRFLDLQKAEAQAREAMIETSVERIRAASLAMKDSAALGGIIYKLYSELTKLDAKLDRCFIMVVNPENKGITWWMAGHEGLLADNGFFVQMNQHASHLWYLECWEQRRKKWQYLLGGAEKREMDSFVLSQTELSRLPDYIKNDMAAVQKIHLCGSSDLFGSLVTGSLEPLPDEQQDIISRFSTVFNQAYTRFLDLQKAEAQAREARIEAALEKIRSRSLAMHKSEELKDVIASVFERLKELALDFNAAAIQLFKVGSKDSVYWVANPEVISEPLLINLPYDEGLLEHSELFDTVWNAKTKGEDLFNRQYLFDEKNRYYAYVIKYNPQLPAFIGDMMLQALSYTHTVIMEKNSALIADSWYEKTLSVDDYNILKRIAKVFEQAYIRFLDLQKAEAQAREAQVEAALEKVRSRSLAMHHSSELTQVVGSLFDRLVDLGLSFDGTGIFEFDKGNREIILWIATTHLADPARIHLPFEKEIEGNVLWKDLWMAFENGTDILYRTYSGEAKNEYFRYVANHNKIPEPVKQLQREKDWTAYFVASKYGLVGFDSWSGHIVREEDFNVMRRFAAVFDQSYTRFLDLQKAEAQAREAQIEAALERVRSRSLAMHRSEEILEVCAAVCEQLTHLGLDFEVVNIGTNIRNPEHDLYLWIYSKELGKIYPSLVRVPYIPNPIFDTLLHAMDAKDDFFSLLLSLEEKRQYYSHLFENTTVGNLVPPDRRVFLLDEAVYAASFGLGRHTTIGIVNYKGNLFSEDQNAVLRRFTFVFDQCYTRFLDLQKAEAQAREAQIEAALERVRARTMGLQKSEELRQVVKVLYAQLKELGFEGGIAGINIMDPDSGDIDCWGEGFDAGYDLPEKYHVPYFEHPGYLEMIRHWKNGTPYAVIEIAGQEKKELDLHYFFHSDFAKVPESTKKFMMQQEIVRWSMAFMQYGALNWTPSLISDEQAKILQRFAKVFEQTYTRFLDLQKAEVQAREAQIEAGLERVRGKAMAMHSSQDLADTIGVFYKEIQAFSIAPRRCGVGLLNKKNKSGELFTWNTTDRGESLELVGSIKMEGHPILEQVYENWLTQTEYHPVLRGGDQIREYYRVIRPQMNFPDYDNDLVHYGYFFFFNEGGVYAWTDQEMDEAELQIYRRFKSVLSLTYKRYFDLQMAEANAREATRRASIERVRGEIASMRTTDDLERITPLIWNELTLLGIPFVRCGVFIMDEENHEVNAFLSSPTGKAIAAFDLDYRASNLLEVVESWRKHQIYTTLWTSKEFGELADLLFRQEDVRERKKYMKTIPDSAVFLHYVPFLQGMLYVGHTDALLQEDLAQVQSLADAFSVAYARYEDFAQLEATKIQIERALDELKQTQTQLVQQEKLASLGQLTAGIAHEIKNPLNFVNNFSEVSLEMLAEILEERAKSQETRDEALVDEVLADVVSNLRKVHEHGTRADEIVKSMLQHSRGGTGKKSLMDVNAVVKEFVNLAFHGMRAGKQPINVDIQMDLGKDVGEMPMITEDFSRVIINICNNAFDAMREKTNEEFRIKNSELYLPKLTVATRVDRDQVVMSFEDNGPGIPEDIRDKILQPFFTTKKGTEGTGLGLSITHDIIRAHGGEIEIETEVGRGTVFRVLLDIPKPEAKPNP